MRGTKEINRSFRGFGKLRVASGTHSAAVYTRLNEMVTALAEAGRFDWLGAMRPPHATITPLKLLEKMHGLRAVDLPKPTAQAFTVAAVEKWADAYEASARHRQDLKQNLRRLARLTNDIDYLPDLLRELRPGYKARGQAHAFHHLKAAALSYLHDRVGQRHPAYLGVLDIKALPLKPKRKGHPCTAAEMFAIADGLGPFYADVWMTYCLAGVGPKELYEDGVYDDAETRHLRVMGQKARGRDRLVPLVEVRRSGVTWAPLRNGIPDVSRRMFEERLSTVTEGRVEPYDGRRTFLTLAALAAVPPIHVDAYAGHGARTMTALYQRGNEAPYLDGDAARMAEFIEAALQAQDEQRLIGMAARPKMLPEHT